MIRKLIRIDEGKCSGCGACASACREGAIDMVYGRAKLVRESSCYGFGDRKSTSRTDAAGMVTRGVRSEYGFGIAAARLRFCGGLYLPHVGHHEIGGGGKIGRLRGSFRSFRIARPLRGRRAVVGPAFF